MPEAQGLYDPDNEHDSCGVGFLCHLKGKKSHDIIKGALDMNVCMDHRGGCGFDAATGDGAGLFFQLPHKFFKTVTSELGFTLTRGRSIRRRFRQPLPRARGSSSSH